MAQKLSKSIINILQHYAGLIIAVVFVSIGSVSSLIVWQSMSLLEAEKHEYVEHAIESVETQLNESIRRSYSAMLSLALIIDEDSMRENFDTLASEILKVNSGIDVLEIVPKGVIKYIHPLEGNEDAFGYDILNSNVPIVADEAYRAIETKKVYFAGPIRLMQGYRAVIGRMPIFRNGKFWGFTAVIIKLSTLIENSGINALDTNELHISFIKHDQKTGQQSAIYGLKKIPSSKEGKTAIFSEGDWRLTIAPKTSNEEIQFYIFLVLAGVLITLFITFLFYLVLKRSNRAFRRLYKELNIHLQNSPLGIVEYDKDLSITKWSKRCEEIFGWTEEEVLKSGLNAYDLIFEEDHEKTVVVAEALKSGVVDGNVSNNRNYTKTGKVVDCLWYNSIFRDEEKNVTSIMSLVKDITEQKDKERELAKREADLSLIFNSTTDLMFLIASEENERKYLFANKSFRKVTGLESEDIIGENFGEILEWENVSLVIEGINACIDKGEKIEIESDLVIEKEELCFSIIFIPIQNDNNEVFQVLAVCRDVTVKKNNEKILGKTIEVTKAQNSRLINFAYIVSHNLRSHTSNISGILNLLEIADNEDERAKLVGYLKTVSESLDDTMSHLNEVVNIQTNIDLKTEPLNLHSYIEKTKIVVNDKIEKTNATVVNNVDPILKIVFNSTYLESVLLNFFTNAIKYRKEGVPPVISFSSSSLEGFTVLEIKDNGSGIDLEKYKGSIFGLYKRFHKTEDGKGLGLFITKNQIEALGGKIEVESSVGIGTTFKVKFLKSQVLIRNN